MEEHCERVVSILDDDESVRRSVGSLLSSVGLVVAAFDSAESFLCSGLLESTGCLVLDLQMPGMDGLGLLAHLSKTGARIPAVILTAHGDDPARQRAMQAGAVAFVDKPFVSAELIGAVRSALQRSSGGLSSVYNQ
jgi:FixJ family two-component response regulator